MRKMWQSDLGIGGLFHRHAHDEAPTDPQQYVTGRLVRFVRNGVPSRVPDDLTVADATALAAQDRDQMALFLYSQPTAEQIDELAEAWGLHPVLVEDLLKAGQRPKLEYYGDTLFLVAKAARYLDDSEAVDFGEFHVLLRPGTERYLDRPGRDRTAGLRRRYDGGRAHLPAEPRDRRDAAGDRTADFRGCTAPLRTERPQDLTGVAHTPR